MEEQDLRPDVRLSVDSNLWDFAFNKLDRIDTKMDKLVDTTNHRLDAFTEELDKKANKSELIVPSIGRWLDTWPKRLIAFTGGIVASTTLVAIFWDILYEYLL